MKIMKAIFIQKSKSTTSFLLLFSAVAGFTIFSCSSDTKGKSANCEQKIRQLIDIMYAKNSIFGQNPLMTNCLALKEAANNVISKIKQCGLEQQYGQLSAVWEKFDCTNL